MTIKWVKVGNGIETVENTTRARQYYFIAKNVEQAGYIAGFYGLGREIQFQGKNFATVEEAKAFVQKKDDEAKIYNADTGAFEAKV